MRATPSQLQYNTSRRRRGICCTCCKHEIWLDHFDCVSAEPLKIWNASRVMESADVNVGHLEPDMANVISNLKTIINDDRAFNRSVRVEKHKLCKVCLHHTVLMNHIFTR